MISISRACLIILVSASLAISGCGGGSSSSASPPPNPPPPTNNAPTASDSSLAVDEGVLASGQMVANDADGDSLTFSVVTTPSNGTLNIDAQTGAFDYTANLNTNGTDAFQFEVSDGSLSSQQATVTITINRTPSATATSFSVTAGDTYNGQLDASDADGDAITYSVAVLPTVGSLTVNSTDGSFVFVSDVSSPGAYSFEFLVSDGTLESTNAIVDVTVTPNAPTTEVAKLYDPFGLDGRFGGDVAVSGDLIIVGSQFSRCEADVRERCGAAFVFRRDPIDGWVADGKLVSSDISPSDDFGYAVDISGDLIAVGAYGDNDLTTAPGSVYIFARSGPGLWTEEVRIRPDTGGIEERRFGISVALDGDTLAVGADAGICDLARTEAACGNVYIFQRAAPGNWTQVTTLEASDRAGGDYFGQALALSGNSLVVGAPINQDNGPNTGAAYVFSRAGGVWAEVQKILPSDSAANDVFGFDVSISGGFVIVGTTRLRGGAYIFEELVPGSWTEVRQLVDDGVQNPTSGFGRAVSIEGNLAIVGAYVRELCEGATIVACGTASLYYRDDQGQWHFQSEIAASDPARADEFGWSVAFAAGVAVVGAHRDDCENNGNQDCGSAYVFEQ